LTLIKSIASHPRHVTFSSSPIIFSMEVILDRRGRGTFLPPCDRMRFGIVTDSCNSSTTLIIRRFDNGDTPRTSKRDHVNPSTHATVTTPSFHSCRAWHVPELLADNKAMQVSINHVFALSRWIFSVRFCRSSHACCTLSAASRPEERGLCSTLASESLVGWYPTDSRSFGPGRRYHP
jgi:hypothetical protein